MKRVRVCAVPGAAGDGVRAVEDGLRVPAQRGSNLLLELHRPLHHAPECVAGTALQAA